MKLSKKQVKTTSFAAVALVAVIFFVALNMTGSEKQSETNSVNMVLCLDDSGSMASKQIQRDVAAVNLVDQMKATVNMGGLYFQYNVTKEARVRSLKKQEDRRELMEMFEEQHNDDGGNTNMGAALMEALSLLGAYEDDENGKENSSVIYLFTDGENDFLTEQQDGSYESREDESDFYIEEANEMTREAIQKAKDRGVVIHAICLNEKDIKLMKKAASQTGGTYTRIDAIEELENALFLAAAPYIIKQESGGIIGMGILILLVIAGVGGVAFYYFQNFKKQEYLMDYQVDMMKDEIDQRTKREELDAQIREEQKNKKFYQDVVVTHGNAIGGRSCFDNDGRRRSGILSIGDILMIGRNSRGEDYTYRIDEAGLELWATFDENELILRSKKTPFEIRKEGVARDQGDRTQKAVIKSGQQYYIVLGTKHEIGLLATRGR